MEPPVTTRSEGGAGHDGLTRLVHLVRRAQAGDAAARAALVDRYGRPPEKRVHRLSRRRNRPCSSVVPERSLRSASPQQGDRVVALGGTRHDQLSAETLKRRGVRDCVVDSGCRDAGFIVELGFPVFCRYLTPMDVVGRWVPGALGPPITIGGVTIRSGDFLLADRDGVVIIPGDLADEVTTRTEQAIATESRVRWAILAGMDPQQAYLRYGKF